jgi:protein tyrosine/serine phosphatase
MPEERSTPVAPAGPSSPSSRRRLVVAAGLLAAAGAAVLAWWLVQRNSPYPPRFAAVVQGELYRSSLPSARQLELIQKAHGLGAVISLCKDGVDKDRATAEEAEFLRSRGIPFRQLPTDTPPSAAQVRAFLAAIDDPALPRPVLVHCNAGRTRTGAMVAIWRITHQGWTKEQALKDARRYGLRDAETIELVRNY